jgi:hypothetical protein
MGIGKIIKSNSHTDYVCQVYAEGEVNIPPKVEDYAFGTFVRMEIKTQPKSWLVGLIYDTVLLNPEFGRLGPRLSPQTDLAVFTPDYLNEKVTLIGIQVIGMINKYGNVQQGIPLLASSTDSMVEVMTADQICSFHIGNPNLKLAYLPYLMTRNTPEIRCLIENVLARLKNLFASSNHLGTLELIQDQIIWQNQISPLGE